jgi:YVTN family beta-propeller protein
VVDAKTRKVLRYIPVGKRAWGIAITPDGKRAFTANGVSANVSVIDTATDKVVSTLPAGKGAWGVAIVW